MSKTNLSATTLRMNQKLPLFWYEQSYRGPVTDAKAVHNGTLFQGVNIMRINVLLGLMSHFRLSCMNSEWLYLPPNSILGISAYSKDFAHQSSEVPILHRLPRSWRIRVPRIVHNALRPWKRLDANIRPVDTSSHSTLMRGTSLTL